MPTRGVNGAEISPKTPRRRLLLGVFLVRWKSGHDLLSLAATASRRTTLTARLRGKEARPGCKTTLPDKR